MGKCFVIQPFDNGKFDKRYNDIFKKAIESAGLEPYRVDQDINSIIPIDDIDSGIKDCDACLVDISIDNPNVWFELGLAVAYGKDTILICSNERETKFPFDVQHRKIIKYSNDSSSDFDKLKIHIEERLTAFKSKNDSIATIKKNTIIETHGLDPSEIVTLVSIAEAIDNPNDGVAAFYLKKEIEKAGFTKIASTLAIKKLIDLGYVSFSMESDFDSSEYTAYHVTEDGLTWLLQNRDKLVLRKSDISSESDDIPF